MKASELTIKKIPTGPWRENCYVVSHENRKSILIDPGSDADKIDDYLIKNRLNIIAIINTHGHFDHVGAVDYFKKKYDVEFYLHSSDKKLLRAANLYMKIFQGDEPIKIPDIDQYIDTLDSPVEIEEFRIFFIESPGHTDGSVCIKIEDALFTGDTLLKNAIGRTDLPGGNDQRLKKSLDAIINLPSSIDIYPGHGKNTTIGNEEKNVMRHLGK